MMGVCGTGKTTISLATEKCLNESGLYQAKAIDADDYHPISNIEKMRNGIPLTDEDRLDWLLSIHNVIKNYITNEGNVIILACSALKNKYRDLLFYGQNPKIDLPKDSLKIIVLSGTKELITDRMSKRTGHFMAASLLASQLEILELPEGENVTILDISPPIDEIARNAVNFITNNTMN